MAEIALVNPDLLIWARESINMDLDEAASRIGVPSDRLRDWEAGTKKPTVNQARKMAQVYCRPLASFFLPQRPGQLGFSVPHDFRRFPENRPLALSPELIVELRRIEYLRAAAIELCEELPDRQGSFVGRTRASESTTVVAERVVKLLNLPIAARQKWRTEYDALNGWRNAIERRGVLVMHLDHVEVGEVRGIAIAAQAFPLIAVNGADSPHGRVFTLLHEFIHLMVGATGMSNLRIMRRPRSQDQRVERFCNHVAGEVLMPRAAILRHRLVRGVQAGDEWSDETIQTLASDFKVSREVAVRRLLILGLTTERFYRERRRQYLNERSRRRSGGPIPMPKRIIRAVGEPFMRIVLDAYHREAISSSELAEFLGTRLKHLPAIEESLAGAAPLTGGKM